MEWKGNIYVDAKLPFGLRSAPKIFIAVADALEWCLAAEGVEVVYHYLDDFAVLGQNNAIKAWGFSKLYVVSWAYHWLLRNRQGLTQL